MHQHCKPPYRVHVHIYALQLYIFLLVPLLIFYKIVEFENPIKLWQTKNWTLFCSKNKR